MGDLKRNVHQNKHLQSSWNKYGGENFKITVLEYCDIDSLNDREEYWILYYHSNENTYGYNIRIDPTNNRGLKWSEEQHKKMQKQIDKPDSYYRNHTIPKYVQEKAWEAIRNKIWTEDERKRQSEILTGLKVKDTTNMKIAQTGENNGCAKLTENDVKEIINLLDIGYKVCDIPKIYPCTYNNISAIKSCRSWKFIDRETVINPIYKKSGEEKINEYNRNHKDKIKIS